MNQRQIGILIGSILLAAISQVANPFLSASNDKPMSAMFRGSEWGDEIQQAEIPLIARVNATRLASVPWVSRIDSFASLMALSNSPLWMYESLARSK